MSAELDSYPVVLPKIAYFYILLMYFLWKLRNITSIPWKVYTLGPEICHLYKQLVFIYRWALEQSM